MGIRVRIPTPLRRLTGGQSVVEVSGDNIKDLINNLNEGYPGFAEIIYDGKLSLRSSIKIFVNEEDIRFLRNLDTLIKDGDEIAIVPAIAGG